jgi:hypothetical protein
VTTEALQGHTPGPADYTCVKCGWSGQVNGRPRCLKCYAARMRQWRKDQLEKYLAQKARLDKRNRTERPEAYNAKRRRNRKPATDAQAYERRKAWLAQGDVTYQQLRELWKTSNGRCRYCNQIVKLPRFNPSHPRGFDHVTSRASGGQHTITNIVVSCRKCNEIKR